MAEEVARAVLSREEGSCHKISGGAPDADLGGLGGDAW